MGMPKSKRAWQGVFSREFDGPRPRRTVVVTAIADRAWNRALSPARAGPRSVGPDIEIPRDLGPFFDIRFVLGGDFRWRQPPDQVIAHGSEAFLDAVLAEDVRQLAVEPVDDRAWGSGGGEEPDPQDQLEIRKT
jgi:hypothetical protein